MTLTLLRYSKKDDHINGYLSSSTGRLCDTVENAFAAIPAGKYRIRIMKCAFRSRKMPAILIDRDDIPTTRCCHCTTPDMVYINSSPRKRDGERQYCPQIAPGNGMHNRRDGAIIVGKRICSGALSNPLKSFYRVYDILRKQSSRGHKLTLIIKESYHKQ